MNKCSLAAALALVACALADAAWAQQPVIYPARGQSFQQQNADMGDCQVWATQTTGVNPAAVAQQLSNQQQQSSSQSNSMTQPILGAIGGGLIGGIAGGGNAAVAGALVGTLFGGWRRNQDRQQQQSQQQAVDQFAQGQLSSYNRAYGACMEGRGYVVR